MNKANKHYGDELKKSVVKEYESGERPAAIARKYGLRSKSQIIAWTKKYREYGSFPDMRGGSRPHVGKVQISDMSKDEYIRYLEMENDILKRLRSLNNNHVKSNIKSYLL